MLPDRGGRNPRLSVALIAVCLLAVVSLPGCDYLPFGFTKIGEIAAKAPQLEGREVKIRGKVVDVNKIPLLKIQSYVIEDDTGSIVVVTQGSLPAIGEEIALRGTAESILILAGQSFGVTLKEMKRLPTPW
jgi:hypothetical protein